LPNFIVGIKPIHLRNSRQSKRGRSKDGLDQVSDVAPRIIDYAFQPQ
jgi:hypothetical protein